MFRRFLPSSVVKRTRLKDIILVKLSDMIANHKGREIILVFEKGVGKAVITTYERVIKGTKVIAVIKKM